MLLSSRTTAGLTLTGLLAAVLLTAGCGCGDDSILTVPPGGAISNQFGLNQVGIELEPTPAGGPIKVDVMLLLDDGSSMTDTTAPVAGAKPPGQILGDPDKRIKTKVAQEIFAHVVSTLDQRLISDGVAANASEFDLAYGVSRFEDYANFARGGGRPPVDAVSRPFILNQPILRQAEPSFLGALGFALSLETVFNPDGGTPGTGGTDPFDAQSALEALYQLATGVGFDGNDNQSTQDSGAVGLVSTMLDPMDSGDVPQFEATQVPSTNPDAPPLYTVGGTNASGNLGGAGWRPGSIRFIILVSDKCTVTSLDLSDANLLRDTTTNTIVGPISNTPSPAGAGPRVSETIENVQAFACSAVDIVSEAFEQQAIDRYGWSDDVLVAPDTGVTLQQTIQALNEMDIEVLNIGIGAFVAPSPNKPNLLPPPTLGEYPALVNPNSPATPAGTPYSFMSSLAILTGARDTNETNEGTPDPRWQVGLPLVYKIDVVSPSQGTFTVDVEADLSDRIAEWKPYRSGGGDGSVYYEVTYDLSNQNPDLTLNPVVPLIPSPDPGLPGDPIYVSQQGNKQIVRVPCYDPSGATPAPIRVAWQVGIERTDPESTVELLSVMSANITTALADPADIPGVSVNPTCGGTPPAVVPSSGNVTVVLPEVVDADNPPTGTSTLTTVTSGAYLFRDLARGIPAGTGIDSMAGPLTSTDVPYPAP